MLLGAHLILSFFGVAARGRLALLGFLGLLLAVPFSANAQMMVLPAKFDVSPQGQATISIPITVPPGTAGMVPSLSINYTSGTGNGPLGVGWSLGGLSAITRCPWTIAQDGQAEGVTYTAFDRFCLDGQRLVLTSGTYGAAGSVYHTESEGFSKITAEGSVLSGDGPAYFIVQTKAGETLEFGHTPDSSPALPTGPAATSAWLLDKITDAFGNYMTIKYSSNPGGVSGNTESEPIEIDYTGNPGGYGTNGYYPTVTPYNKVTFVYANNTRPDIIPHYANGNLVEITQRLTDIITWSGTQASPDSIEVNDYKLGYATSPGTGRSLLTSIQMCDAAGGNCLPARTFSYSQNSAATFTVHQQTAGLGNYPWPPSENWAEVEGDFNNDGRTDFAFIENSTLNVYLSNGDGTFTMHQQTLPVNFGSPPTSAWTVVGGDFNGDGRGDFALVQGWVLANNTIVNGAIDAFLSNGDGTFTFKQQSVPFIVPGTQTQANVEGIPPTGTNIGGEDDALVVGDFRGNGRSDFAFVGPSTIYTYLSNGDGTFTPVEQSLSQNFVSPAGNWDTIVGELNGDGKTDFALISGSTIWSYLSNGDGTFTAVGQTVAGNVGSPPSANWIPYSGDFNGDGLTDAAFIGTNSIYTLLSKGDGTFAPVSQAISQNFSTPPSTNWTPIEGDFTGDGMTDLALLSGNTLWAYLSKGNGTFTANGQTLGANYGSPPSNAWTQIDGDFDGNGLGDFGFLGGNTLNTYFSNGPYPDLLTSFSNGVGALTTINYETLAQGFTTAAPVPQLNYAASWSNFYGGTDSACSSAPAASYPTIDISGPIPVVVSTASSSGNASITGGLNVNNSYQTNYTYSCERANVTGRGLLGFAQQTAADPQTGILQSTNFLQSYPYIGLVSSQTKTFGNVTLNSVTNTYNVLTPSSSPTSLPWNGSPPAEVAPQFPYLSQSVSQSTDMNGVGLPTVTTNYTYDAYGEPTTITTSKTGGYTQTTTNVYGADNTASPNWILGRLTQSTVSSTSP